MSAGWTKIARLKFRLTGLDFPEVLPSRNPLFFFEPDADTRDRINVHDFPERREVNSPTDIIRDNERPRPIRFSDDEVDVFIAAALVNPAGNEREGEWVSIINLTGETTSIDGWKLSDDKERTLELKGAINAGEALRLQPLKPVMLANSRAGFIQLVDNANRQIDRVRYSKEQAQREGRAIIFANRELG